MSLASTQPCPAHLLCIDGLNSAVSSNQPVDASCSISSPSPSHPIPTLPEESEPTSSKKRPFACTYEGCTKTFNRFSKLEAHYNVHTGARPYVCGVESCGATFRSQAKLRSHARTHLSIDDQEHLKRFVCDIEGKDGRKCGKRFRSGQHLARHQAGVHDVGSLTAGVGLQNGQAVKSYRCTETGCHEAFAKRKQLRQHIWDLHTDWSLSSDVDTRLQTHPFLCPEPGCGKRFPTNSKRRAHHRTHAEDRYMCTLPHLGEPTEGPLKFSTWSALQAHMRETHPPTCPYESCNGKVFKNNDNLKAHIRRHEERSALQSTQAQHDLPFYEDSETEAEATAQPCVRQFRCGWVNPETNALDDASKSPCDRTFKSAYARDTHVRVFHLKVRPFKCKCGKAFGHKHLLKRHENRCEEVTRVGNAALESSSDLDSEEEDDFFRQNGGALPDSLRDHGTIGKRRRSSSLARAESSQLSPMADLLTGRGYADVDFDREVKKQRHSRGRVLPCPWSKYAEAKHVAERGPNATGSPNAFESRCDYRFFRVYDVRRHLKAAHCLDLEQRQVIQLLDSLTNGTPSLSTNRTADAGPSN